MRKIVKTVYNWAIISFLSFIVLFISGILTHNVYLSQEFIWFLLSLIFISSAVLLISVLRVIMLLRYYYIIAQKVIGVTHTLARYKEVKETLQFILTVVANLLKCERATLFLLDKEKERIISYVALGLEIKEISLPLWFGIVGDVMRTGKMANIKDVYKDSRFSHEVDKQTNFKTKNLLCIPMHDHAGNVFGAIEVLNKYKGRFTEMDEFLISLLAEQIQVTIENAKLYEEREKFLYGVIKAFSAAIDARDPATRGHSERVARYALAVGRELGLGKDELTTLEYASLLHDVGKIGIRDEILLKPAEYTQEEREIIKRHVLYTKDILNEIKFPETQKEVPMVAATHHERLDGSGYPFALKEESLSLLSKILAVVDVYDALVAYDRPYKPPHSNEEALKMLVQLIEKGKLDRTIVEIFIQKKLYQIEKREFIRLNAELAVEYRVLSPSEISEQLLSAHSQDISPKGIRIIANDYTPVDSILEIKIYMMSHTISCFGRVVHISKSDDKKYSIGICFIGLRESDKEILKNYIIDLEKQQLQGG